MRYVTLKKNENKYISLVLATIGKYALVDRFIDRLLESSFDISDIELIIVNQDEKDNFSHMERIVNKYQSKLDIILINITDKGLSKARNIGISLATGSIIGFPDDDCEYFTDLLTQVKNEFELDNNLIALLGRICDYEGRNVIRNWPHSKVTLKRSNFYTKINSITLFIKRNVLKNLLFDERLGAGMYYGSNEDTDIIWALMKKGKVIFSPSVKAYHPVEKKIEYNRIISYGRGFGGFCRKNFSLGILFWFFIILSFHVIILFYSIIRFNKSEFLRRICYIKSRFNGFFSWTNG